MLEQIDLHAFKLGVCRATGDPVRIVGMHVCVHTQGY